MILPPRPEPSGLRAGGGEGGEAADPLLAAILGAMSCTWTTGSPTPIKPLPLVSPLRSASHTAHVKLARGLTLPHGLDRGPACRRQAVAGGGRLISAGVVTVPVVRRCEARRLPVLSATASRAAVAGIEGELSPE
jgi:hypothetical protein